MGSSEKSSSADAPTSATPSVDADLATSDNEGPTVDALLAQSTTALERAVGASRKFFKDPRFFK
jgi:hypothetical protein